MDIPRARPPESSPEHEGAVPEPAAYDVALIEYSAEKYHFRYSSVPTEEAVTLYLNGQPLITLMCTPIQLEELALGFLFNQGLIQALSDVVVLRQCGGERCVDIWLAYDVGIPERQVITSGCSGGATFKELAAACRPVEAQVSINPRQVFELMDGLFLRAKLHQRWGGFHTAALAHGTELICVAEDIGRHNAVDKVAGICLSHNWRTHGGILLTSGRISSEMVQKAARLGVPLVVSRTAPTSLAVQLAHAWKITLVGYVRRHTFRLYTHPWRIIASSGVEETRDESSGVEETRDESNERTYECDGC